ncbi:MAG: PIG-L family deacetylase [Gemmatimonadaceae bacterium]|nr:PIG-L family deacetylase [Gemmatimonadaceae bacterium]
MPRAVALRTAVLSLAVPVVALAAQEPDAVTLDQRLRELTVTARVLIIGAHPDDEDHRLTTWLSRARGVETGYLSLTRGENGLNLAGYEVGDGLGAVRTAEVLEARRLDGARQFFTRAYDFGYSRNADETFQHWPREAVLGDMVTIIRAFRPQVVIARYTGTSSDGDGHHEASALLAREAFEVGGDTARFPVARHGFPWNPLSLFGPGTGTHIDVSGFDPVSGRTWLALAVEARAVHRTQGYPDSLLRGSRGLSGELTLARIATRASDTTTAFAEPSLFDGIDTTFARLGAGSADTVRRVLAAIVALADTARHRVDLRNPDGVVSYLARAARLAAWVRGRTPRCLHPAQDASLIVSFAASCSRPDRLDADAAIDLVARRAAEAAFIASGVHVTLYADREQVAYGDSVPATLTVSNHGRGPVQFVTLAISGVWDRRVQPVVIPPDSAARWALPVRVQGSAVPWWLGPRVLDLYEPFASALDGLARPAAARGVITIPAVAIPEAIRRPSDVTVTVRIDGQLITMSTGPILHRSADAASGVQDRVVSGVPAFTLGFDHSLEWIPAGRPVDRLLRFSVESHTDSARTLSLHLVAPAGLRVDSLPRTITLAPRQGTELLLRLRGTLAPGRVPFGLYARDADSAEYDRGLRTVRYPHLRPITMSRGAGLWLQGVEITVPSRLNVAYLQGVGDLITPYLRQLGVRLAVLGYDELLNADLSRYTTVVVGPRAYEAHPELVASNGRLLDFARRGGTLLVLGGTAATYGYGVFPYPLGPSPDGATDRVTMENAPVRVLLPQSRLLAWPNRIVEADWGGWASERASDMPRAIDSRYAAPLGMNDPEQPESTGALLVAPLGRGTYIFTTLALVQQLPAAVPGAARLFVNLMSAGLEPVAGPGRQSPGR